jgi:plastocyanin
MKRICTAAAVLGMALIPLAGCGGDDSEPAAAAPSAPAAAESTPAPDAPKPAPAPAEKPAAKKPDKPAASTTEVTMVDNAFDAKDITIKVGDTVSWENAGALPHTATATAGADFDSGTVSPGGTFEWTAKKAGVVSYVCTFHPGMEGTITVQ